MDAMKRTDVQLSVSVDIVNRCVMTQLEWKTNMAVLNLIRFPDRDPTGFCNSDPDGFRKNSTESGMDI